MRLVMKSDFEPLTATIAMTTDPAGGIDGADIMRWVLDGVAASAPAYLSTQSGTAIVSPKLLLSLITYCYATGILEAQEITEAAEMDPLIRYLCAGKGLSPVQIRQFRRRFRDELKNSLVQVFSRCCDEGIPLNELWKDSKYSFCRDKVPLFQDNSALHIEEIAEERIRFATLLDTANLDD